MSVKLILASHGNFAKEALKTAEMIIGKPQKEVDVISVTPGRTYDECLSVLKEKYQPFQNGESKVLILVDIYGGTPANISTYLTLSEDNVQVYSGLNLPVLLEILLSNPENMEEVKGIIDRTQGNLMVDITEEAKKGADNNGNQVDSY